MNSGKQTRQTLLQKLQTSEGDEKSWNEFVKYYEGYIYVVIRGLRVDVKDCEDLLQDVLVKVWKNLPKYDDSKSRFRTWLCVVIRNTVFNFFDLKANRNSLKNVSYNEIKENINLITDSEIHEMAEKEWKSYIANMAWDNLKNDFSEINRKVFEASWEIDDNAILAERFDLAESSIRVYKMRIRKAVHKEIVRLNHELGG